MIACYNSTVSGEECATTDQFENFLGYIQQEIRNSSEDGMRSYNINISWKLWLYYFNISLFSYTLQYTIIFK